MANCRVLVHFFQLCLIFALLALPLAAEARTGVSLTSNVEDSQPPSRWLAVIPGTDRYVAEKRDGWGFMEVSPGNYELLMLPGGSQSLPINMGRFSVNPNEVTEISLDTGVRLNSANGLPPLPWWFVVDVAQNERVAQIQGRWGFTPLPAGQYRLEAPIPGYTGTTPNLQIGEGRVPDIDVAELGIRQIAIDMPAKHDVRLAFGGVQTTAIMELDGEYFRLSEEGENEETIELWLEAEPVAIERHSGSFVDRVEIRGQAGERVEVPFDPEQIARDRELSLVNLRLGENVTSVDRLTIMDRFSNKLLLSEANPSLDGRMLAPGGIKIRAKVDSVEINYDAIPAGSLTEIEISAPEKTSANGVATTIDIALESPEDGDIFDPETSEITIVGHASTTSTAGATKIALVIDTSGSTEETSGADLDGDGEDETILEAEVSAALELIDALLDEEDRSPGTAFALSLIRFGQTADALTPMLRLTDTEGVDLLRKALRDLLSDRTGGDTYYDRAFDTALRVFDATQAPGPEVILFISDGKPSQLVPGLDAAARVGRHGAIIHAVGLGPDFRTATESIVNYPPGPDSGVDILATVSALGHSGGQTWPLPKPADIVKIVPDLPVLERPDAEIEELQIENTTIDSDALSVELSRDGSFKAIVPVQFAKDGGTSVNTVRAVARSLGGEMTASDRVRVQAKGFETSALATIRADADAARAQSMELADLVDDLELRLAESSSAHAAKLANLQEEHRQELANQQQQFISERQQAATLEDALKAANDDLTAAQGTITLLEQQLSDEKETAELSLASLQEEFQTQLFESQNNLKSLNDEFLNAEQTIQKLETDLQANQAQALSRESRLLKERDAAKDSLADFMAKFDRDLEEEKQLQNNLKQRLTDTSAAHAAELASIEEKHTHELDKQREQFDAELQQAATLEDTLRAAQGTVTRLEQQLSEEKEATQLALASLQGDYQTQLNERRSKIESLNENIAKSEQTIQQLRTDLLSVETQASSSEDRLTNELEAAKGSLADLMAKYDRDLAEALEESERRESQNQVLRNQLQTSDAESEQCRNKSLQCRADLDLAVSELFEVIETRDAFILTVPSDVLFDFDSAAINSTAEDALRLASTIIDRHPRSNLIIEGHTDGIGAEDYNLELSKMRADTVAGWLAKRRSIASDRIETVGFGETQPVANERTDAGRDSPEGRQKNRRVGIKILK